VVPDADGVDGVQLAAEPHGGRAAGGDVQVGAAVLDHEGECAVEQADRVSGGGGVQRRFQSVRVERWPGR
jgi:hypothetical protein